MEKNPRMQWEISQKMHIIKLKTPFEGKIKFYLILSRENIHQKESNSMSYFFREEMIILLDDMVKWIRE